MKLILGLLFICLFNFSHAQNCQPNSNSLGFDGTSAYVNLGAATSLDILSGPVSVEAWVYSTSWGFSSAQNTIFCTHGWTSGEQGMSLRAGGSGELSFNIAGLDSNLVPVSWKEVISPANSLQLNTWTHVAGTYSGTELKLFINGLEVASTGFVGSIVQSGYGANIGKLADASQSPGRFWSGNIDEVRVWNRALSSSELLASSAKHIDPLSSVGLVGYWRLNEGTGSSIADLGNGANNGTHLNCTWSSDVPFNEVPPSPSINFNGTTLITGLGPQIQWNLGGSPISGANSTTYNPTQNGSYTVTHTNLSGCSATSAAYLVVTVGIESIDPPEEFKLWPNPAGSLIHLQSALLNTDIVDVSFYDAKQMLVKRSRFVPQGPDRIDLDVSLLSDGVYYLRLSATSSQSTFKVVIINHN
ncbi:MAG: T9SS type A sorting domain-containing protein [Bacteroidetes bacterium]|nr:MAG: T9SS type A sorting domain-containing protein [Bacteroidota bacterium]